MEISTSQIFIKILEIASLLPRADKELQQKYDLSRKQIYLLSLIHFEQVDKPITLSNYANLLNISASTLARNIEKLELRKVILREKLPMQKGYKLKLLSLGQLYALEIDKKLTEHITRLSNVSPQKEIIEKLINSQFT